METWDAIRARRNVRAYTDEPIEPAALDRILEAARRTPSSRNWQPWDFVVVTEREHLRDLAAVWQGAGHVAGSAATIALITLLRDDEHTSRAISGLHGTGLAVGASKVSGLLGQTTSATVARTAHLTAPIHPLTIVIAFAGALLGGLIAGAVGGWRAARLAPASALRDLG